MLEAGIKCSSCLHYSMSQSYESQIHKKCENATFSICAVPLGVLCFPCPSCSLSDSASSITLFNCVIKLFSGQTLLLLAPLLCFKPMKLHRPFLSPLNLWMLVHPAVFPPLWILCPPQPPGLSVNLPVCHCLSSLLDSFHRTSSVLRWK